MSSAIWRPSRLGLSVLIPDNRGGGGETSCSDHHVTFGSHCKFMNKSHQWWPPARKISNICLHWIFVLSPWYNKINNKNGVLPILNEKWYKSCYVFSPVVKMSPLTELCTYHHLHHWVGHCQALSCLGPRCGLLLLHVYNLLLKIWRKITFF